ncbi:MAG TPA: hypothetical protein DIT66_03190 [Rhodobiaceae bacterium]|nr:hypothetical protein [Rhodobiaceae bacterium]
MTPGDAQTLRRIGKRFLKLDSRLRPDKNGDGFQLFCHNRRLAGGQICGGTVKRWIASDLVSEMPDRDIMLNKTGRAWVRRDLGRTIDGVRGFQAQHQVRAGQQADDGSTVQRNVSQTVLEWVKLRPRGARFSVSDAEFAAGMQLQNDVFAAQYTSRMGMDWSRPDYVDGGGHREPNFYAVDARRRVQKALYYVGPGLSHMVLDMCCELRGVEENEKLFDLPRRSSRLVLKLGLSRLSVFYGLQSPSAAAASFRIR